MITMHTPCALVLSRALSLSDTHTQRGASFLYWSGLPKAVRGTEYTGLIHAADWLPTILTALKKPLHAGETLPLDGVDQWSALQLVNGPSPRKVIYYGISQSRHGPAVRNHDGFKLIVGGDGGGKGEWSLEQLPNKSSSSEYYDPALLSQRRAFCEAQAAGDGNRRAGGGAQDSMLYNVVADRGEHTNLSLAENAIVVAELEAIVARYAQTKVPQAVGDPACPKFSGLNSSRGLYIGPWCDGY